MNKLIYICGPHCAGKTTIINKLKEQGIAVFAGSEIGKNFYYERKKNGFNTAIVNNDFEYEVTDAEISRDLSMFMSDGIKVVETWHPGNLAYILERNPAICEEMVKYIKAHTPYFITKGSITGICLNVRKENIFSRTETFANNRIWAADFYSRIGKNIEKSISILNLDTNTFNVDANGTLDDTYNKVKTLILNS